MTAAACRVCHGIPQRFEATLQREEAQWQKRELQIAALRGHSSGSSAAMAGEADLAADAGGAGLPPPPPAYVAGCARFAGLTFSVSRAVMVPRQSTVCLVRAALGLLLRAPGPEGAAHESAPPRCRRHARILDLGTGPGNVLLAVLHHAAATGAPDDGCTPSGVGMDISDDALALARRNAADLGFAASAAFVQGDFGRLHDDPTAVMRGGGECDDEEAVHAPFDLIVCNPPYLCMELKQELAHVAPSLQHEPARALFAAAGGTAAYAAIVASVAQCSPPLLASGGHLLFEVGAGCATAVVSAVAELGIEGCCCTVLPADGVAALPLVIGDADAKAGHVLSVTFADV